MSTQQGIFCNTELLHFDICCLPFRTFLNIKTRRYEVLKMYLLM